MSTKPTGMSGQWQTQRPLRKGLKKPWRLPHTPSQSVGATEKPAPLHKFPPHILHISRICRLHCLGGHACTQMGNCPAAEGTICRCRAGAGAETISNSCRAQSTGHLTLSLRCLGLNLRFQPEGIAEQAPGQVEMHHWQRVVNSTSGMN